jgi:hypothetical protein
MEKNTAIKYPQQGDKNIYAIYKNHPLHHYQPDYIVIRLRTIYTAKECKTA